MNILKEGDKNINPFPLILGSQVINIQYRRPPVYMLYKKSYLKEKIGVTKKKHILSFMVQHQFDAVVVPLWLYN